MATKKKWLLLLVVSLALSLLVPLVLGGVSQFKLIRRLSWGAIFLLISLKFVSWAFNALRTQFLLGFMGRKLGFLNAAMTTISAEFAGISTPGDAGMAATYTFLFNRLGLKLGMAAGVVGFIMLADLAVYATLMPAAAVIQIFQGGWSFQNLRLVGLSLALVAGGALFFWYLVYHFHRLYSFMGRQMGKFPWLARRRWRLGRATVEFLRAVRLLRRMSRSQRLTLYLITLNYWLPRYLILLLAIDMVGHYVPAAYLLLAQAVLHLAAEVSFIPSGAGTVETGYAAFMSPFMGAEASAFTLLVWRFFTFYWYLIVGSPIFIFKVGRAAWDLLGKPKEEAIL